MRFAADTISKTGFFHLPDVFTKNVSGCHKRSSTENQLSYEFPFLKTLFHDQFFRKRGRQRFQIVNYQKRIYRLSAGK